jgi:hypothetical protein
MWYRDIYAVGSYPRHHINGNRVFTVAAIRASPSVSLTRHPTNVFSSRWRNSAKSRPRFLVFVRIWTLIHQANQRHPRYPGDLSEVRTSEKRGRARTGGDSTHKPHRHLAQNLNHSSILSRRQHNPSGLLHRIRRPAFSTRRFFKKDVNLCAPGRCMVITRCMLNPGLSYHLVGRGSKHHGGVHIVNVCSMVICAMHVQIVFPPSTYICY